MVQLSLRADTADSACGVGGGGDERERRKRYGGERAVKPPAVGQCTIEGIFFSFFLIFSQYMSLAWVADVRAKRRQIVQCARLKSSYVLGTVTADSL